MPRNPVRARLFAALLLLVPFSSDALTIVATPQATTGSYRHSLFHSAESSGGAGGSVLAWIDLDTSAGAANQYDPVTGDLTVAFGLFADLDLLVPLGTAIATGNVPAAPLSDAGESNVIVGSLSWEIDLSSSGSGVFYDYLVATFGAEADDTWDVTTHFADVQYVTSIDGRTANTWVDPELTLWGSDGSFSGSSSLGGSGGLGGFGNTADLGVDLVVIVPEPAALSLGLVGALGLALAGGRVQRP